MSNPESDSRPVSHSDLCVGPCCAPASPDDVTRLRALNNLEKFKLDKFVVEITLGKVRCGFAGMKFYRILGDFEADVLGTEDLMVQLHEKLVKLFKDTTGVPGREET